MRSLILATVLLAGCADTYGTWKGDLTRPEWTTIRFDEKKYTKETLEPVFSGSIAQMRNVFVIVAAPDCEACRLIRDWWSLTGRVPSYASFIYIDAVNASSALKAKALIDVITSANPMPFEYQGGHDS